MENELFPYMPGDGSQVIPLQYPPPTWDNGHFGDVGPSVSCPPRPIIRHPYDSSEFPPMAQKG